MSRDLHSVPMVEESGRRIVVDSRWEGAWVAFIILTFIAINFSVATHTPTVSPDEPGYTDPAANFYLGSGFTSTMWAQDRHAFWSGNVPLYQILLSCFFQLFGFGFFQARAINTLLAALAGWMIWLAIKRTGIVKTARYRVLCLLLIFSGSVSTLTIRTIRPDTTMFVVCAGVFLAWTIRTEKWRLVTVFLVSSLLLPAGLPMLPYSILMLAIYVGVFGMHSVRTVLFSLAGMIGGVGWLALCYGCFSSISTFVDIILPFTVIGQGGPSLETKLNAKFFGDPVDNRDTIFTCFFGNPVEFINPKTLFDYSSFILLLTILGLTIVYRANLKKSEKRIFIFALLLVLIVPPGLHMTGHYRSVYRWMTYMPLCVLAPCFAEMLMNKSNEGIVRRAVAGAFLVAILLGVPVRTIAILPWWSNRSIEPLNAVAKNVVANSDVVVADFKTYFAIRPLAKTVFLTGLPARGNFDRIKDLPKSEITLLCLRPEELEAMKQIVGGSWKRVDSGSSEEESKLAHTRYDVSFYRRTDSGTSH